MIKKYGLFILTSMILLLVLSACGSSAGEEGPELGDRGLYNKGLEYMKEEDYKAAVKVFSTLENNFPNSIFYQQARLGKADSMFLQGYRSVFIEAEAEYKAYLTLYPTANNLDYVQKQIALCHWNRKRSYKNDQTETIKAIEEFEYFLKKYPDSKYLEEVQKYLTEASNHLAKHEAYVGSFYFKIQGVKGAVARYDKAFKYSKDQNDRFEFYQDLLEGLIEYNEADEVRKYYNALLNEVESTGKTPEYLNDIKKDVEEFLKEQPKKTESAEKQDIT
jgi:outer membrane protein assembly factor BamD